MADPKLVPPSAIPSGFRFAATRAGIKASGNPDLACIITDAPASAAAMFTSNQVVAAPVTIGRHHLARSGGQVRAVLVNAGNANCATGQQGVDACIATCKAAAAAFDCRPEEVFPSSTGIIGVPLPTAKVTNALSALKASLGASADHFSQVANAIMTTDTRSKFAHATVNIDGLPVRILGTCKGAGMIQPKLTSAPHATMLAYLLTDALIAPAELRHFLHSAVETSFNRISIDGDTSTNDTVLLLASGTAGTPSLQPSHSVFQQALNQVATSLARQIVADGEGVQHVVELKITGAPSDDAAVAIARSIANSPLVKTAWAGSDPNWGRILCAVGNAGVPLDPSKISIHYGDREICREGGLSPLFDEALAHQYLAQSSYFVAVDLHQGSGTCHFWTCDLTNDYVKINADYST